MKFFHQKKLNRYLKIGIVIIAGFFFLGLGLKTYAAPVACETNGTCNNVTDYKNCPTTNFSDESCGAGNYACLNTSGGFECQTASYLSGLPKPALNPRFNCTQAYKDTDNSTISACSWFTPAGSTYCTKDDYDITKPTCAQCTQTGFTRRQNCAYPLKNSGNTCIRNGLFQSTFSQDLQCCTWSYSYTSSTACPTSPQNTTDITFTETPQAVWASGQTEKYSCNNSALDPVPSSISCPHVCKDPDEYTDTYNQCTHSASNVIENQSSAPAGMWGSKTKTHAKTSTISCTETAKTTSQAQCCTHDVWWCTSWGACDRGTGKQARSCTKGVSCTESGATAVAQPITQQSCVPACDLTNDYTTAQRCDKVNATDPDPQPTASGTKTGRVTTVQTIKAGIILGTTCAGNAVIETKTATPCCTKNGWDCKYTENCPVEQEIQQTQVCTKIQCTDTYVSLVVDATYTPASRICPAENTARKGEAFPNAKNGGTLHFVESLLKWTADRFLYNSGSRIGIGTTVPSSVLDINGALTLQGIPTETKPSTDTIGRIYYDNTQKKFLVSEGGKDFAPLGSGSDSTVSSQWTTLNSNIYFNTGSVGIGITAPEKILHINGVGDNGILISAAGKNTKISMHVAGGDYGYLNLGGSGATATEIRGNGQGSNFGGDISVNGKITTGGNHYTYTQSQNGWTNSDQSSTFWIKLMTVTAPLINDNRWGGAYFHGIVEGGDDIQRGIEELYVRFRRWERSADIDSVARLKKFNSNKISNLRAIRTSAGINTSSDPVTFEVWMKVGAGWQNNYQIKWEYDLDGFTANFTKNQTETTSAPIGIAFQDETPYKMELVNNDSTIQIGSSSIFGSSVGIGTTSPGAKLEISSDTQNTPIWIRNSQAGGNVWSVESIGNISGRIGNFEINRPGIMSGLTITTSGNVGIGTQNPGEKLDVNGSMVVNRGGSSPDTISNLKIWLKPESISGINDGAEIATWPDASGQSNSFITSQNAAKPLYKKNGLNGISVVKFSSNPGRTLYNRLDLSASSAATVIYFAHQVSGGVKGAMLTGMYNNWILGWWGDKRRTAYFFPDFVETNNGVNTDTDWHMYSAVQTGALSVVYEDGREVGRSTTALARPNGLMLNPFGIGGGIVNRVPIDSEIAEVIVFDKALNDTERQGIEQYLFAKYKPALKATGKIDTVGSNAGLCINGVCKTAWDQVGITGNFLPLSGGTLTGRSGISDKSQFDFDVSTENTAFLRFGDNAVDNKASAKIEFAGWGILHGGLRFTPYKDANGGPHGKFIFSMGGADDPEAQSNQNLLVLQENGNVGIGTTSPGAKLEVSGDIRSDVILTGQIATKDVVLFDRYPSFDGWSGPTVKTSTCGDWGMLGGYNILGANMTTGKTIPNLPAGEYVIEFDYYKIDSWDNEKGEMFWSGNGPAVDWEKQWNYSDGVQRCGNSSSNYLEDMAHGVVRVTHSGGDANFGFGSTLNEPSTNESFGVNNILVYKAEKALSLTGGSVNAVKELCLSGDCKTAWSQVSGSGANPVKNCSELHYINPTAASGLYLVRPDGNTTIRVYCDMITDGGGWTLVLLNSAYATAPAPNWENAVNSNNIQGNINSGLDSGFDQFIGVKYWNSLGNQARMETGANSTTINHRAYAKYALDAARNYALSMSDLSVKVNTGETANPGMYVYHAARNLQLSTSDRDNDIYTKDGNNRNNCSTHYSNAPWWYGDCWDGSFWGGGTNSGDGYQNKAYWTSSGGEYFNWGAIWVRDVSYSDGSIGVANIGTTNPTARLDIQNGGSKTTGLSVISGYNADDKVVYFSGNPSVGYDFTMLQNGRVGIGNMVPQAKLHVRDDSASMLMLDRSSSTPEGGLTWADGGVVKWYMYQDNGTNDLKIQTPLQYKADHTGEEDARPRMMFPGNSTNILMALSGGNVGIGTISPQAKLHIVDGGMHINGPSNGDSTINANTYALQIGPKSDRKMDANTYYAGLAFNHLLNYSDNRYNGAPQAWIGLRLHTTPGSERSSLIFATKPGTGISDSGDDIPQERMTIDPFGNVGIGTTAPAYTLDVSKTITARKSIISPAISMIGDYHYGVTNSPTWNKSNGSYVNNNATAPDGSTTAGTYMLSTNPWDIYQTIGVTSGKIYKFGAWVKLGTATNFCVVINNTSAWNTVGGKCFATSDGLSTTEWTHISYAFTGPATNKINLHIGAHLEALTQQTAGTVYVWNLEITTGASAWIGSLSTDSVGIGTANPSVKLDVNGDISLGGGATGGYGPATGGPSGRTIYFTSTVNDFQRLYGEHNSNDTSNLIFHQGDNEDDGVIFRSTDWRSKEYRRTQDNDPNWNSWEQTVDYMKISRGGMYYTGGNVGIGTTPVADKKLTVAGDINATGQLCIKGDCKTAWPIFTAPAETDPVFAKSVANGIAATDITNWNSKQPAGTYLTGVNSIYGVTAGDGNGIKFWNNDAYKIHMGNTAEYHYGPVTDYSIKTNMSSDAGRGWTWGISGSTPVAAISNVGDMQIAGNFTASEVMASDFYTARTTYTLPQDAGDKWIRIAKGTGNSYGDFRIIWESSSQHGNLKFTASCNYPYDNARCTINVQHWNEHSLPGVKKIRIVRKSTYDEYYLEVLVGNNNTTVNSLTIEAKDNRGFSIITPIDGATPAGYVTQEVKVENTRLSLGNGTLSISNTDNVGIGTTPGAKLDVNGNIYAGNSDIYFTKTDHAHTGTGNTAGYAAIENASDYNALMILGRSLDAKPNEAGHQCCNRVVKLWDYLQVNGNLDVNGGSLYLAQTSGQTKSQLLSYNNATSLWLMQPTTQNLTLADSLDWDRGISMQYTAGATGSAGGQLILGQINKNNTNFTHGITSLYTNGSERVRIDKDGNVGIGTTSPAGKLDVIAGYYYERESSSVAGEINPRCSFDNANIIPLTGNLSSDYAGPMQCYDWKGTRKGPHSSLVQVKKGGLVVKKDGSVGIGTTNTGTYKLAVKGDIATSGSIYVGQASLALNENSQKLTLANSSFGFDVAELFETEETVAIGDVVVTSKKEGLLKKSSKPYEDQIVGIVSGSPALLFEGSQSKLGATQNQFTTGTKPPIALSGRVSVKISLENGLIKPGDYLTSSGIPGVAMKATKPGMTLGTALESYTGWGDGTVLVFINIGEKNSAGAIQELQEKNEELQKRLEELERMIKR